MGIYSTKPAFVGGLAGGENTQGQVPQVVVGLVPVIASAEKGPIRLGDLLVTSAAPGNEMKAGANTVPGTIIGRALGLLGKSTGLIEVLVILLSGGEIMRARVALLLGIILRFA